MRCMHQRNGLRNKERVKEDYIIIYTPARQRGKISSYLGGTVFPNIVARSSHDPTKCRQW